MRDVTKVGWTAVLLSLAGHCLAAGPAAGTSVASAPAPVPVPVQAKVPASEYRVRVVRWDPVLRQSWTVLEDKGHPEWPLQGHLTQTAAPVAPGTGSAGPAAASAQAGAGAAPVRPTMPVVHYGDQVTLWRTETNVRLQMSAIAEGSGAVGQQVPLRIVGAGANGSEGFKATGIVRGPSDVEMEP